MAKFLDHNGLPIERTTLEEPQTSRLGHLAREFENHPLDMSVEPPNT